LIFFLQQSLLSGLSLAPFFNFGITRHKNRYFYSHKRKLYGGETGIAPVEWGFGLFGSLFKDTQFVQRVRYAEKFL
jgi:hypothetical protein